MGGMDGMPDEDSDDNEEPKKDEQKKGGIIKYNLY